MTNYSIETSDDVMSGQAEELARVVIGHRIVSAEKGRAKCPPRWAGDDGRHQDGFILTLDNGTQVILQDNGDCCAYTELEAFLLNPSLVDHIITGVGTTDDFQKWHIYADMGDVLELTVGWSEGSGYYAYGFDIFVAPVVSE